jgi:hypothetical protein
VNWVFVAGAVLVVAGWLGFRTRMARLRGPRLTDEDIRRIEAGGSVIADEPLDLDEASEEEERFWDESWDEPERL